MLTEILQQLATWNSLDTGIVVTAILVAMSCALPGCFLVLRKQALLGDALTHGVLPAIVTAQLGLSLCTSLGWLTAAQADAARPVVLMIAAAIAGIGLGLLAESLQQGGRVEPGAALGIVFVSLFALGLLLIRLFADGLHLDPGCVLYGQLESVAMRPWWGPQFPVAAVTAGCVWLTGMVLLASCYHPLLICTFDPQHAQLQGARPRLMANLLLAYTSVAIVVAFESVGSILVVAMIVVPPCTALLLTDRLWSMQLVAQTLAAISVVIGHAAAIGLAGPVCSRLGYPQVTSVSTAGSIAMAAGGLFLLVLLLAPQRGLARKLYDRWVLGVRIAKEDLLGLLYRCEERGQPVSLRLARSIVQSSGHVSQLAVTVALRRVFQQQLATASSDLLVLTDRGRSQAQVLVRGHRLWEAYLAEHLRLGDARMHTDASRAEHFLDPDLHQRLASELDHPELDPHGQTIPPAIDGK